MKLTASRLWHAPASALRRLASGVLDFAFDQRIARVRRLRQAGRHGEADRVLRAVQREIEARRRS